LSEKTPTCILCEQTSETVPLVTLTYRGGTIYICPTHLPVLIHEPARLAEKIPGLANLPPAKHDH
jgi:hypothetical protein